MARRREPHAAVVVEDVRGKVGGEVGGVEVGVGLGGLEVEAGAHLRPQALIADDGVGLLGSARGNKEEGGGGLEPVLGKFGHIKASINKRVKL